MPPIIKKAYRIIVYFLHLSIKKAPLRRGTLEKFLSLFAAEFDFLILLRNLDACSVHVALAKDVCILVDVPHVLLRYASSEVGVVSAVPLRARCVECVAVKEVFLAGELGFLLNDALAEFSKGCAVRVAIGV